MTCTHHWTVTSECPFCLREQVNQLRADLAAARALLAEARESWIKVGYGASHEDVADCSDLCRRIDAAIAGKDRT